MEKRLISCAVCVFTLYNFLLLLFCLLEFNIRQNIDIDNKLWKFIASYTIIFVRHCLRLQFHCRFFTILCTNLRIAYIKIINRSPLVNIRIHCDSKLLGSVNLLICGCFSLNLKPTFLGIVLHKFKVYESRP